MCLYVCGLKIAPLVQLLCDHVTPKETGEYFLASATCFFCFQHVSKAVTFDPQNNLWSISVPFL